MFCFLMVGLFFLICEGCFQKKASEPVVYEREKNLPKVVKENEPQVQERYPWVGKTQGMEALPNRILETQDRLKMEGKILEKAINRR